MKKQFNLIPLFVASGVAAVIGICLNLYLQFKDDVTDVTQNTEIQEEHNNPTSQGYLTVFDYQGVTHFQYEGEIIIENDGSNGEPINIQIYVPPSEPSYNMEDD